MRDGRRVPGELKEEMVDQELQVVIRRGEEVPGPREGGLLVGVPGEAGGQIRSMVEQVRSCKMPPQPEFRTKAFTAHITRKLVNVTFVVTCWRQEVLRATTLK